jgi:integrase
MKLKREDKLVRALGEGDYHDTVVPRLTLRVRPRSRRYVIRYRLPGADPKRLTLGDAKVLTLAAARVRAKRELGLVDSGKDPQDERQAQREAQERRRLGARVEQAVASWLADRKRGPAARWKGGIQGGTARSFMPHVRRLRRDYGDKLLEDFTPKNAETFVTAPAAPATRNRALTTLKLFAAWAIRKKLISADPTDGLKKETEVERVRVLTDAELKALIHGFDATRYGRAVRLLALTGLRREEVLGARWEWLDLDGGVLTIPPAVEKAGLKRGELRRVPLSRAATHLLAEQRKALFAEGLRPEFVFPTSQGVRPHPDALKPILYRLRGRRTNGRPPSTDKRAVKRKAVIPDDVTLHDVRRTVADALLVRIKASPWVVDHVVMGHVRPKVVRTYMPTLPLDEARAALDKWAKLFERILAGRKARA